MALRNCPNCGAPLPGRLSMEDFASIAGVNVETVEAGVRALRYMLEQDAKLPRGKVPRVV